MAESRNPLLMLQHIGKARQIILTYCRKKCKTLKRQQSFKSMKAYDSSKSGRHGKGSAELPFLQQIGAAWQTILPYCRKNGKTAKLQFFFEQIEGS